MIAQLKTWQTTTVCAVALMSMGAGTAKADSTAAEIKLLKAQLRALERKVAVQSQAQQRIARIAVAGPGGAAIYTKGPLPALCPDGTFSFKGICITPGGFLAGEAVINQRAQQTGLGSSFQNLPFNNSRLAHVGETRFTAQQSRFSLLAQGKVNPATILSGYAELDFLGGAQSANFNESNSFTPRIRNLYATIDQTDWGFHVLAGQNWSLVTMNAVGIEPRKENIPLVINPQFVPGFNWARQAQIRLTQQFGQFTAAIAAEDAATTNVSGTAAQLVGVAPGQINSFAATIGACSTAGASPATVSPAPVGGYNTINACNTLSLNHVPDFTGKVAFDPTFFGRNVHVEGFGVLRDFYDRTGVVATGAAAALAGTGTITTGNANQDVFGGGGGGSVLVSILPKVLDVQASGSYGNGMGRYGTSQLPDVTFNTRGQEKPIPEAAVLFGAVLHLGSFDVYGYAGQEEVFSTVYKNGNAIAGYGNLPGTSNLGCNIEGSTLCTAQTRKVREATVGIWDNVYKGSFGLIKAGVQYAYTERYGFNGGPLSGTGVGVAGPKQNENTIYTSLRYYPF